MAGYLRAHGAGQVEDLSSEVFLGVFTRLRTFTGNEQKLRSWVFTIAHHRLVDALRRESRQVRQAEYDPETDERSAANSEDQALAVLGTERVKQLLDTLSPDQREVLLLRIVGDLTVDQIAEILGKTAGAVKALQRRGLTMLRGQLDRQGVPL